MNEMTDADRFDGRSASGMTCSPITCSPITCSPIKGMWYDTTSIHADLDQEFVALVEHAE